MLNACGAIRIRVHRQAGDGVPDWEFGYWPQTEKNRMFSTKLDRFLGLDTTDDVWLDLRIHMPPAFEEEILETKANGHVVMRGTDGIVAECCRNESDESSIPHYLRFPVETPRDWEAMKERFRFDNPDAPSRRY